MNQVPGDRAGAGRLHVHTPVPIGVSVGAAVVAALLGHYVSSDNWLPIAFILGLCGVALAFAFPRPFTGVTIALYASELRVPEASGQLKVFILASAVLLVWLVARSVMDVERAPWNSVQWWTALFIGVVGAVMIVRGFGLQALGDSKIGGFIYIRLIASALLVLLLPGVRLGALWRRALLAMCALSTLPLLADLSAVYVRSTAGALATAFQLSPAVTALTLGTTTYAGPFRWFSAMAASTFVTLAVFLMERRANGSGARLSPRVIAGALGAFAIGAFSGHRLALLTVLGLTTVILLLDGRLTIGRALQGAAALATLLVLLAAVADQLPVALQRAVSWIPGAEVSYEARRSATDSVNWRLAIWLLVLAEIPTYLWIGRGIAYAGSEYAAAAGANLMAGEANWAIVAGYYHNGALSLLILFGLAGILVGLALTLCACVRHVRLTRRTWAEGRLRHYHRILTSWLVVQVVFYWIVYGDVQVSFPPFFFTLALLEAIAWEGRPLAPGETRPAPQSANASTNSARATWTRIQRVRESTSRRP